LGEENLGCNAARFDQAVQDANADSYQRGDADPFPGDFWQLSGGPAKAFANGDRKPG
jgi:hypothetical protein